MKKSKKRNHKNLSEEEKSALVMRVVDEMMEKYAKALQQLADS